MSDNTRAALDRLLSDVPIAPVPIDTLLSDARAAKRRKRWILAAGAAAAALVIAGSAALASHVLTSTADRQHSTGGPSGTADGNAHVVTVRTTLQGPTHFYVEGALTQVELTPRSSETTPGFRRSGPQAAGTTTTWTGVSDGEWTLTGSTRPCSASCPNLDAPMDTCTAQLNISANTSVSVTFRWGQPCEIHALADRPVVYDLEGTWSVGVLIHPNGKSAPADSDRGKVRLTFDNGTLTGTSGCNDIFGTYQQSGPGGEDLRFPRPDLVSTLVYCSDEPPLFQTLLDVRHLSTIHGGNTLHLHADNWMIIAVLERHQPR